MSNGEKMDFPKSIWEFLSVYSFKDEEKVYTNGSLLIPTFRVKQAIEHYYEDCVSREAVIKIFGEVHSMDYNTQAYITNIQNLPSVTPQQTRWIPCSERLPKADEYIGDVAKYYLVQNEYGDILVARYTHGEYWEQIYQLKPIADKIIAWMPLPQPYKTDSEWGSIGNNTDLETVPTNLQDWLSTFNTESATECFTAVQQLKERMNE